MALLLVLAARAGSDIVLVLRSPRAAAAVVLSALLIAVNWLTFIYAVQTDRILATSLGYYINPHANVVLGLAVLRERLTRAQGIAVAIAACGVAYQTWQIGEVPWISLVLATSFGLYGLVRKLAPATPLAGFCLEVLTLSPAALFFLGWLALRGDAVIHAASAGMLLLIFGSGLLTAAPLVAFASAANRLPLSSLGMFQYIAPTLALLLAVTFYGEPFTRGHAVGFGCVWTALALFLWDGFQRGPLPTADVAPPALELYPRKLEETPEVDS